MSLWWGYTAFIIMVFDMDLGYFTLFPTFNVKSAKNVGQSINSIQIPNEITLIFTPSRSGVTRYRSEL